MAERPKIQSFKSARAEIEAYGFYQPFSVRKGAFIFSGTIAVLFILVTVISQFTSYSQEGTRIAAAILSLGAFIIGFQQWRAVRHEVSMDKLYDRLDKIDQRLEHWASARAMLSHFWEGKKDQAAYECHNYVYLELDNLEYIIEKYKMGYISPEIALRGLNTFRSRCLSREFRALVLQHLNELEETGYKASTVEVAKRVCKDLK